MLNMTDRSCNQTPDNSIIDPSNVTLPAPVRLRDPQLHYPQLLLEVSLQSLLTHSYSSSEATPSAAMPHLDSALSESWATLSDTGSSHDDDHHSESTDVGSLLDVHNAEDVHSMDERGESSDTDGEENNEVTGSQTDIDQEEEQHSSVLQQTNPPISSMSTSVTETLGPDEKDKGEYFDSAGNAFDEDMRLTYSVNMKLSERNFTVCDRPFLVLYMTTPSVPATVKDEVLRKLGAILVAGNSDINPVASCYHVIPSEFGPGATPESTELIPIQTQMLVRHIETPLVQTRDDYAAIHEYELKDDSRVRCGRSTSLSIQTLDGSWQTPDVVLALVSAKDADHHRDEVSMIASEANNHIPVIMIQSEAKFPVGNAYLQMGPNSLSKTFQPETCELSCSRTPVDACTFDTLDSEQLNRHIQFLKESFDAGSHSKLVRASQPVRGAGEFAMTHSIWHRFCNKFPSVSRSTNSMLEAKSLPGTADQVSDDSMPSRSGVLQSIEDSQYVAKVGRSAFYVVSALIFSTLMLSCCYTFGVSIMRTRTLSLGPAPFKSPCPSETIHQPMIFSTSSVAVVSIATTSSEQSTSSRSQEAKQTNQLSEAWSEWYRDITEIRNPRDSRAASENCLRPYETTELSRGSTLSLPAEYFGAENGKLLFEITVLSNGKPLPFSLQRKDQSDSFFIELQSDDFRGVVEMAFRHFEKTRPFCVRVDLRDTLMEALAAKLSRNHKPQVAEPHFLRLISIRMAKESDQTWLGRLRSQASQPLRTMEKEIEKALVRQGRACYEDRPECFIHRSRQFRENLYAFGQQISQKARMLGNDALYRTTISIESISAALPTVDSITDMVSSEKQQVSEILVRAQDRAQRLLGQRDRY